VSLAGIFQSSCASSNLTAGAAQVLVHEQMSTLADDCKKLGPVIAYSGRGWSEDDMRPAAVAQAQQIAHDRYGADTLVIVNSELALGDPHGKGWRIQGVACKCFP